MPDMLQISWKERVPAVSVRFLKPHGLWNGGERAGFPAAEAARLVDAGVAVYVPHEAQVPAQVIAGEMMETSSQAPQLPLTKDDEEAGWVEPETKDTDSDDMKRKALKRPSKDKMVRGRETK